MSREAPRRRWDRRWRGCATSRGGGTTRSRPTPQHGRCFASRRTGRAISNSTESTIFFVHDFAIPGGDATLSAALQRTGGAQNAALFAATAPGARLSAALWVTAVGAEWGTYAGGDWRSAGHDASTRCVISNIGRAAEDDNRLLTDGAGAVTYGGAFGGDANDRRAVGREYSSLAVRHFSGRLYGIVAIDRALGEAELARLIAWQKGAGGA